MQTTTQYSERELVRRAGRFGERLQDLVGDDVVITVALVPPEDPGAHVLDGEMVVSWPLPPTDHTVRVTLPALVVWADPADAADQVADAIVEGVRAAKAELGVTGRCV